MIVTCPNCETKFEIPDDKYKPGRKARCSNCGHVFPLPELGPDGLPLEPEAFTGAPEETPQPAPMPQENFQSEERPDEPPAQADSAVAEESVGDAPAAEEDEPSPDMQSIPDPSDDVVLPPGGKKKSRGRKNALILIGILFVLALLGFGGLLVYKAIFNASDAPPPVKATDDRVTRSLGGKPQEAGSEKEAARQAAVRRLALENVRQHTVTDNEKTGPMIVIEGSVANNFDTPKDLILLEITLYDDKGKPLVVREQYCGISLSLLQLRSLPKAALEAALTSQVNILNNNTDIQPGGRVPFSTVFFDLPKAAYEFEVKIVDVQDPAPKK